MIRKLRVRNYAIVRDLSVDFDSGLTILSGETGAGKSILIGALSLVMGERASSEAVRAGEDLAVIEAEIDDLAPDAVDELREMGVELEGDSAVFRREIQARGTSRAFVAGRMVPVGALRKIVSGSLDLVGQHQQQYLMDKEHHIEFLDTFGGLKQLRDRVCALCDRMNHLRIELDRLREDSSRQRQLIELYRFQAQEIDQAGLSQVEEESLLSEKTILENAERFKAALTCLSDELVTDDQSISSRIAHAETVLREAAGIDSSLSDSLESLAGSRFVIEDLGRMLASRAESIEADPARLRQIEDRLDVYYDLKKKYGGSIGGLYDYHEKIMRELHSDVDLSGRIDAVETELRDVNAGLAESAIELSSMRAELAGVLAGKVDKEIAQLGIEKGVFEVRCMRREDEQGLLEAGGARYRIERDGIDDVEFFFSANPGEEIRPLAKIASGGELSRVMLALKTLGAARRKLETLIFDEVDSGIGGKVASAVGRKLRKLAARHQIIVITHLQQIAAAGEHQYKVFKEKSAGRMVTKIRKLSEEERRLEIGRMLSGDKLTETSLKQAGELLEQFE